MPAQTDPLVLTSPVVPLPLEAVIKAAVIATIAFTGGNRARAARLLGINRRTLYRKLAAYDIEEKKP